MACSSEECLCNRDLAPDITLQISRKGLAGKNGQITPNSLQQIVKTIVSEFCNTVGTVEIIYLRRWTSRFKNMN